LNRSLTSFESHDEDGTIEEYRWEFGDGQTGSGKVASHTFATFGTYSVTLTVIDDGGAAASQTQFISVSDTNANPAAVFDLSCTGLTCHVDGSDSYDIDGSITEYQWSFGEGTVVSGRPALPNARRQRRASLPLPPPTEKRDSSPPVQKVVEGPARMLVDLLDRERDDAAASRCGGRISHRTRTHLQRRRARHDEAVPDSVPVPARWRPSHGRATLLTGSRRA
jgi:hypothetical protein